MNQGVSLYLTMVALSIMTAALLGLVTLAVSQIKIVGTLGDSVVAFYAADQGIERASYEIYKTDSDDLDWHPQNSGVAEYLGDCVIPGIDPCYGQPCEDCDFAQWEDTGSGAKYKVCISPGSVNTIHSTGQYKGTQRKIEINF